MEFYGYRRPDGRVGVRNKVLILPASVCASDTTRIIAQQVTGSVTFNNQQGCAQVAPDQQLTMDVMAGHAANPNIYGTVVDGNVLRYAVQQNPNHSMSTYTHMLDPYTAVTAGGYAYYLEGATLYLKPSATQSGSVIAAWYSEEDKLLGIRILNVLNGREVTANVSGAKTVKIFAAANTDYHPLCEATVCTIG